MRRIMAALTSALIAGCTTTGWQLPHTLGEQASGYGYVPLDGLAVLETLEHKSCNNWQEQTDTKRSILPQDIVGRNAGRNPFRPLLETLPDISVRFAVASFDTSGGLTFGPAKVTAKGRDYRAILDYVNVDALPVTLWVTAFRQQKPVRLADLNGDGPAEMYKVVLKTDGDRPPFEQSELVTVPVYVGIGMRLSADIRALEGGVPLTSLGAIGLEAQAKRLIGTLTVQTIGITGESVATSLPLPSSLDQTTIENGILAIGSNRAIVYRAQTEDNRIVTTPRVVGLYSPIGSEPRLINAIYSELSREMPRWARPCVPLQ